MKHSFKITRRRKNVLSAKAGAVPVLVMKEGSSRSRGRQARHSNIMAARVIAEAVRSSLGLKGMDKMLETA
jgi:hypothetical protein